VNSTIDEDLVEALNSIHRLVSRDPRDWASDRHDAFIFGVFVGWQCQLDHEHDDACRGAQAAVAERHGWDDAFVSRLSRLHRAVSRVESTAGGTRD
jgi:hypothetical protein